MDQLIGLVHFLSPIVFFICIFDLYLKRKFTKISLVVFLINLVLLFYLLIKSLGEQYIEIYYGIIGIIGFIFALGGIINYYRNKNLTKEQKINFAIYLFICLLIGFGMCSTTGIFGF